MRLLGKGKKGMGVRERTVVYCPPCDMQHVRCATAMQPACNRRDVVSLCFCVTVPTNTVTASKGKRTGFSSVFLPYKTFTLRNTLTTLFHLSIPHTITTMSTRINIEKVPLLPYTQMESLCNSSYRTDMHNSPDEYTYDSIETWYRPLTIGTLMKQPF